MKTVSFKLSAHVDHALDTLAKRRGSSRSAIVRAAILALAEGNQGSVAALAHDLIGSLEGPDDLSSNPKHMADFGK